ncbi:MULTISPECIES: LCP family protein [Romboutsia]|uniref:LytR transcriptional regulator n=1 Tax=Romboutsia hominis TaxID=1507512 RepID=A0A2P2BU32_9FIRM|nr:MULTISPECIES: LCP family protein [Romboutsia]MCH1961134.1 LCP family protein [Romboutsia hominis]MCH1968442.1 LCP family protein [Romboutsia hominis]MDB8792747.1 LCP family protein [Romboutsia sp. 1001216sp1]MDB8795451.1 LCP family protein [Romboutsia sp. 1001216sp1]MDB8799261.1 LCP family protein [Romboutsia sp. 1001216sp1]
MSRKKNKKRLSPLAKFVIFLAVLVVAFPLAAFGYLYFKLNSIHDSSVNSDILNNNQYKNEKGITNILLIGTDERPGEKTSRSDTMMILTIDNKNKSLKLTSLARDAYVDIPGHGKQKLTHAYAYGKESLLIETIEKNFEVDIQDYATVNFYSFMDIVDALGGVEVDVKENEIKEMNKFIPETYKWDNDPNKGEIKYIEHAGNQKLNGYQLLSYSRIRKNDSAFERDRRQRNVIQGLINGVKNLPVTKYPELLNTILPYVRTNMSPTEIIGLGTKVLSMGNLELKQMEFPIDDGVHSTGHIISHQTGWVLEFTPDSLDILHDFIFKDIMPKDNPNMK